MNFKIGSLILLLGFHSLAFAVHLPSSERVTWVKKLSMACSESARRNNRSGLAANLDQVCECEAKKALSLASEEPSRKEVVAILEWILRFDKGELSQAEIEKDPFLVFNDLSDYSAQCLQKR